MRDGNKMEVNWKFRFGKRKKLGLVFTLIFLLVILFIYISNVISLLGFPLEPPYPILIPLPL